MPNVNAERAWELAEKSCFLYLIQATRTLLNRDAFLGRLPDGAYDSFMFTTGGGGTHALVQPGARPQNCWRMDAMLTGIYRERGTAQRIAGLVRNALPADNDADNLDGVQLFRWTGEPTIEPDTIATPRGEERDVWRLEYPLELVFYNQAT